MKFWKRLLAIAAGALMLCSVGACGNKTPNSETDLEIFVWKTGYGVDFIDAIVAEFKKEYPQYNVILRSSSKDEFASNIELGARYNSTDLYFTTSPNQTLNSYLEPLDDVLASKYKDEEKTIAEKYDPVLLENFRNSEDGTFVLSYASSYIGIVYNSEILSDSKVPVTTNQLIDRSNELKNAKKYPFIHFATEGYWAYFYPVWQAQYDGMDYFKKSFLTLTDESGKSPSKEVYLKEDGRRQALQVLDDLIQPDKVASGSSSQDFTTQQTKFLNSDDIAMMVTGTWLNNEMKSDNDKFKMMKTPVVSSIIYNPRLDGSIEDDDELAALIAAVDAAPSAEAVPLEGEGYSVTSKDAKAIYEARNITYCISDDNGMCIPNYASAKEAAKDFVRFFHSDKAMKIYEEVMNMPLPYDYSDGSSYDSADWSEWNKNILKLRDESIPLMMKVVKKSDIFLSGGATPYAGLVPIIEFMKESARPTASDLWTKLTTTINENWTKYLSNAGLEEGA